MNCADIQENGPKLADIQEYGQATPSKIFSHAGSP